MEPKNRPIKSRDSKDVVSPTASCPVDTEDYFELAYEADEFGVYVPDYLAVE
jgi:hypothetical protein